MMVYMPYIWAAILIAAIVIETQTMDMLTIWFMPSALIAMVLGILKVQIFIQCLVFIVLTVVLLILSKTVFKRFFKRKEPSRTNADALIGQEAVIVEAIDNHQSMGSAKLNGLIWSARAENENEVLQPGDIVIVKAISGVKLICVKKDA